MGVRFFTYTILMHHLLESLQKYNKEFMVLDRPNPLGDTVYGESLVHLIRRI
ncbi:exo-beta-N-acetylmuramidase NamZ domain-containing protein [Providencia vermicola]|uniref:exo-beta-N-acetylmuramidase NamZ domain-containing protein n=1 Tax=Providencia vermicola TaxID=333965 RepID=UPI003D2AE448